MRYTKDNETSAPVIHFFCDRSDYSARLHVLDDNEGQMTGPTSWKAESGFVCLRCIKRHGEWYLGEQRSEEYAKKRPQRRFYALQSDNELAMLLREIAMQLLRKDMERTPVADESKAPPELVLGKLTEFNYSANRDGRITLTMEYFTQEQVDAQVWANSK